MATLGSDSSPEPDVGPVLVAPEVRNRAERRAKKGGVDSSCSIIIIILHS